MVILNIMKSFMFASLKNPFFFLLLYSTWNSAQCYVAAWIGGEFEGEWVHLYAWLSLFGVYLKLSQYC